MGAAVSFVAGVPSLEKFARSTLMGKLEELRHSGDNFEQFQMKILDIFTKINSSMPGVRYDVPTRDQIQLLLQDWNEPGSDDKKKQQLLKDLFKQMNPVSNVTIVTGIVAPPAAMITKRALENVPKVKVVRFVPDAVFVPFTTLTSLAVVRFCTKIWRG